MLAVSDSDNIDAFMCKRTKAEPVWWSLLSYQARFVFFFSLVFSAIPSQFQLVWLPMTIRKANIATLKWSQQWYPTSNSMCMNDPNGLISRTNSSVVSQIECMMIEFCPLETGCHHNSPTRLYSNRLGRWEYQDGQNILSAPTQSAIFEHK